jgi:pimeloyl-ACP methyl ester carboxylesterase
VTSIAPLTRDFLWEGQRLVFDDYRPARGPNERPVLLLPGLLFTRRMHRPLAATLAGRGHRVLCLDLLGHGDSDRPEEMWNYSMPAFGAQAIGLLELLEIDQAVVGGTSLGANATLEAAVLAPQRVRGMLIEMPVLDNALLACALAFTPLLVALTFGARGFRALAAAARRVPRGNSQLGDILLDWASQDPKPSASVLQGLFFGRMAPPRAERQRLEAPALVIGHQRDPVHPFSDSDMLVAELPNSRLFEATSLLELQIKPERLTREISRFVSECWEVGGAAGRPEGPAAAGARPA